MVADIDSEGLMIRQEDKMIVQPFGDRSGVVIEPMLTDQWYVDAAKLAGPAIEAVRSGDIAVVPETWKKTWFNWLENIQPWCVSRQLWWGHRIPAWFDADGNIYVAETVEQAQSQAGEGVQLKQDEDVLDTWFSSALWPFATLGWPEQTEDLKRHYPNDVLISGFDILFFWDARMAMQGIEFMGEAPWKTLYLHGLVRDAHGQKMSKSKGNTVDPLGLIDKYGADALRFTLAAMESQGRDIKLDEKRVEGYRNFATKLWNAARFLQMNGVGASDSIAAPAAELPVNRWIIGEVVETLAKLDRAFDELRYDEMADAIYHFVWGTFCDWYVELIKGAFDEETKRVAAWAFDQILVMLHPLMPFITEELWDAMGDEALRVDRREMAGAAGAGRPARRIRARLAGSPGGRNPHRRGPSSTCRHRPSFNCSPLTHRTRPRTGSTGSTIRCRGWPGSERSSYRASTGPEQRRSSLTRPTFALPLEVSSTSMPNATDWQRAQPPPRRNATASPSASPTPTSPSVPSPKRLKRRAPTMTPKPPRPNGCVRRWSGWDNLAPSSST